MSGAHGITEQEQLEGLLLGTLVGDALGLPAEGLAGWKVRRIYAAGWRHRLVLGRGMASDDSEHAFFTGQALLQQPESAAAFARCLGWKLRWWLAALPAGVGLATLRSIMKLWIGFSPQHAGVRSAGNGPAMRAPLLGFCCADDATKLHAYVAASTRLTHTDRRALTGALAVAEMAALIRSHNKACAGKAPTHEEILAVLGKLAEPGDAEWQCILEQLEESWRRQSTAADFAHDLGCRGGVNGYIYQTVPVAIFAWRRHYGDFRAALEAVLNLGGDTDTVGAICGALAGAVTGPAGIPCEWLDPICEWPRGKQQYIELARRLAAASGVEENGEPGKGRPVRYFWPGVPLRNLVFLLIVLAHGVRRLLPPY